MLLVIWLVMCREQSHPHEHRQPDPALFWMRGVLNIPFVVAVSVHVRAAGGGQFDRYSLQAPCGKVIVSVSAGLSVDLWLGFGVVAF